MQDKIKKDDRLEVRISSQHKKILKHRAIDKGYSVSDYILYCVMREIIESEVTEIYKEDLKQD